MNYRKENIDKLNKEVKSFVDDCEEQKQELIQTFVDPETMKYKKDPSTPVATDVFANLNRIMGKHKTFLDKIFEMIINHPYPITRYKYWKDLSEDYTTDFKVIKKFNKLNKYKIEEFKEKHKFSLLDEFVASFFPNKRQFDFLKNICLKAP